jgi:hypothetical protein
MLAGLVTVGAGAVVALGMSLVSCAPSTVSVAGTTEPARAACRILYSDFAVGDQHTQLGGCIAPRDPSAPNTRKQLCRDSLNAAWGVSSWHVTLCDNPIG